MSITVRLTIVVCFLWRTPPYHPHPPPPRVFPAIATTNSHSQFLNRCAAVLAHEMAHVLARHSAEAITGRFVFLPISITLALLLETTTGPLEALHTLMVGLPGSRAMESEADLVGMHLAARACFDPEGMVNMLQVC